MGYGEPVPASMQSDRKPPRYVAGCARGRDGNGGCLQAGYAPAMADDVELIIQLPRDSAVDRHLREDPPPSVASGRIVVERLPADAEGKVLPPPAGEVVLSVLSPEALSREADQVRQVIKRAAADGEPLVVVVQAAEELREDELAAVLDAAARTRRVVLLRVLGSI